MRTRVLIAACAAFIGAGSSAGSAAGADLQKAISFSGPQSLRSDNEPNDYRLWGNRDYVARSGTRWIKLWVSWYDLQQDHQPSSQAASWAQLDKSPNLSRLDAQVRAANADGVHVLLTLYQAFPTWASGATGPDPLSSKPAIQKLPLDLSPDGPWAWFVGYLSNRYDGSSVLAGKLDALEVVNEPNNLYWPQDGIVENTATMMRTAEQLSYLYGRQAIVGPATSDYPDPGGARPGVNVDWKTFTAALLDALAGWQPRVPVHWSQHNYRDVKYEDPPETSRAKQTIDMLAAAGWPEAELWLTEGGLNLGSSWSDPATRDAQAAKIARSFEAMRSVPEVTLWTQHVMNDVAGNNFKSGLRDDFESTASQPGTARPAWATWMSLDGTRPIEPVAGAASAGAEPPIDQPPASESGAEATSVPPPTVAPATDASAFAAPPAASAFTVPPAGGLAAPPDASESAAPQPVGSAASPDTGGSAAAAPAGAAIAPDACGLTAPKSFGRAIHVGRGRALTLPGAHLTAAATRCTATVLVTGRFIHVTRRLTIAAGSTRPIRIAALPRLLPASVTIKVALTTKTRTWRTRLVR
ncbi:MAG TPA: hypothetical protein VH300_02205 [Thermoleophilaceae bacterium]|jgi:hypothetical protein|nr:hypothetical protein [Thermoleophilaceae bacterium]